MGVFRSLFIRLLFIAGLINTLQIAFAAEKNSGIVEQYGKLSVQGTQLVGKNGQSVVLKGVSFGWHNWWSAFYNYIAVRNVVNDWNSTVVRAAIGVGPQGSYTDDPEKAINCAITLADAAIEKGIYVILDWHSHDIYPEQAKLFFTQMATRYKDYPNVIYEIFNEPDDESWDEVKKYSIELIRTIRAIDPDNLIIVGVPHWDQDVDIAADHPITGYKNIMYALHFYAATHKEDLRKKASYALNKGIPLFVSECAGMEASGDGPINYEEWDKWMRWLAENQISWAAWSVSDKDETCSMLRPGTDPAGKWTNNDLKEWAKVVIKYLQ